jgi:hypothetical protein
LFDSFEFDLELSATSHKALPEKRRQSTWNQLAGSFETVGNQKRGGNPILLFPSLSLAASYTRGRPILYRADTP